MSTIEELSSRLDALARRVQTLEDELALQRTVTRYGYAVDSGDPEPTAALFTEDTHCEIDGDRVLRGRDGIRDLVRSDRHQAMVPNCAHSVGPVVVEEVGGDRAVATGYSRVFLRNGDAFTIYRVSLNRWELQRRDGRWQIARRTTRLLGSP